MLKALQNRTRDDKGFTLIELMVVVLIIAILIAIAIPTFLGMRRRAQDRAAQSNLRNAITAAKAFYTDGDTFSGFDKVDGEATEASLTWLDPADANPSVRGEVKIDEAATNVVHLVAYSDSTTFFCIRESNGAVTYGSSGPGGAYTAVDTDVECDDANF